MTDLSVLVAQCQNHQFPTHPSSADPVTDDKAWRLARAQAMRFLKDWDEGKHPRVPAGGPDGGQFGEGGGGGESKPSGGGKGKKPAKKEDFDKANINLRVVGGGLKGEQEFIDKWNDKVGMEPEEFKQNFLGGVPASMAINVYSGGTKFEVKGGIKGTGPNEGMEIGTYEREVDLDAKKAYSAYFKLDKSVTKHDTGKKVLKGNIDTYKKLGIEKVSVSANIDVGGYAWAKYGYLPTQDSWNTLRSALANKLGGRSSPSSSRPRGDNTIEADDWSMLSDDMQSDVRDKWMRESRDEFIASEEQNWRESGQAKDDAKYALASLYNEGDIPEWANEAFDGAREYREEKGQPPIPYTNKQLFDAITLDYESRNGDGEDDPEITFHDDKLGEPEGYDPDQQTLPGIEPVDPASYLTQDMRDRIEKRMIAGFDKKAEDDAQDMTPPDHLADNVSEYQDEYWDQKSDREKLQHAIDYGMADIEIEPDEDEEEPQHEMELPEATTAEDPVLAAVNNSDPRSIWKIADSSRGKELLLNTSWAGVLNLKNKEQMDRFDKYVGKAA